jgi:hypothetical protein
MEKLNRLNKILKQIDELCLKIKRKTLGVMKEIKRDGKNLSLDIQENKPYLDTQTILQMLQDGSMKLTNDADIIANEIHTFSMAISDGKSLENCGCEMLESVWFGDAFDGCEGYEGFVALKEDLETQLKNISLERVMQDITDINII